MVDFGGQKWGQKWGHFWGRFWGPFSGGEILTLFGTRFYDFCTLFWPKRGSKTGHFPGDTPQKGPFWGVFDFLAKTIRVFDTFFAVFRFCSIFAFSRGRGSKKGRFWGRFWGSKTGHFWGGQKMTILIDF